MREPFFDESTDQSQAKAAIVSKYFDAWAAVISRQSHVDRIAYIDLFAGPGRYKDGTVSTPLLILRKAIADPILSKKLVCLFNDKDELNTKDLEKAISELPGIESLTFRPDVSSQEIGAEVARSLRRLGLFPHFALLIRGDTRDSPSDSSTLLSRTGHASVCSSSITTGSIWVYPTRWSSNI